MTATASDILNVETTMIAAEIVESTGDPAFASRPESGIIAWNEAAEELLGYEDTDVLGRPCFQVLAGKDVFGNRYCSGSCALVRMALNREAIGRFEIRYRHKSGRGVPVGVSIIVVPNDSPAKVDIIHVLDSRRVEHTEGRLDCAGDDGFRERDQREQTSPAYRNASRARLTPREIEVLKLMGEGFGTRAIAGQLNISVATARNHIQHIFTRLEVHNRLEAVCVARRIGLI
jgi:PAS domain S-box-containing protein